MMTRKSVAATIVGAVIVSTGGALAVAHSAGAGAPQSPVQIGPSADTPEPGDIPDVPGQ